MSQPFDGEQLEALFQQATSLDEAACRQFLERVTHANPRLGQELASLVEADAKAQDFLRPETDRPSHLAHPEEGRDIGPYRLLSKIGQGGHSEVYLAIRLDGPFRRRVAVKVMTLTAGAGPLRRFRAEQQILAGLEHPNIARLYDGGTTEMGLPFFVMEYIEGEPINTYCRRHQLPVQERVRLVQQVCRGVQHAHQNLVVHRDLKPANILVTTDGVPKLLDFGIAKSLNPEITNLGTHPTTPWDRMLTPQYASPEQISGLATTTPSDVYSLGIILFEVLTGRLPYCFENGMTAADMERQLLEGEPPTPSQVVRQDLEGRRKETSNVEPSRLQTSKQLAKQLEGDLDNIVAKALRHDPQQRYGTALQLAEDLERYCLGLPIEARSPSMGYLAGRFLSRYRLAVALGATVFLLLLASVVGFASLAWELGQERDLVVAERDRAQLYASLLEDVFQVSTPEQARGEQLTAREILDRAAERVRWLPSDQAHSKADLMATLGDIYRRLGLLDEAEGLLLSALELGHSQSPSTPGIPKAKRNLARLEFAQGNYDNAKMRLEEIVEQTEARYGRSHLLVAEALFDLADGLHQSGDYDLASALASEVWELQRRLGASMEDQLATRMLQANLLATQGQLQEAMVLQKEVLEGYRRLYGDDHFKVAETFNDLAAVMVSAGQFEEAEPYYLRSLEIRRKILDPAHPEIVQSLNNLASLETYRNRPIEAVGYARQALDLAKQSMPEGHPNLSFLYLGVASARLKLNDPGGAEEPARRSYELRRDAFGPQHPLTVRARMMLAKITLQLDCLDEAEGHLLAIRDQLDPQSQNWLRDQEVFAETMARLYRAKDQPEMAARYEAERERAAATRLAAWN